MESMDDEAMGIEYKHANQNSQTELQSMFVQQSFSDGLLEMTAVQSLIDLAMDHCRRIGQPESPFEIKFNEQEELDESCSYI